MRIFSGFFAFRSWAKRTGDAFRCFSIELMNPDAITINSSARLISASIDGTEKFAVDPDGNIVVGGGVQAPVTVTAATLAVTPAAHAGRKVVLSKVDGQTITLPAATGSGAEYHFIIGLTITSVGTIINVTGNDTFKGVIFGLDGDGVPANAWAAGASDERFTMDGSTQGGVVGDEVIFRDIAADIWQVSGRLQQSGTEATPFSSV